MLRELLAQGLAELACGARLGEYLPRDGHDAVEVDAVETALVVAVAVELLGQDRLGERPEKQAVVGGDRMHGPALHHEPYDLAVEDQRFELAGVERGEP